MQRAAPSRVDQRLGLIPAGGAIASGSARDRRGNAGFKIVLVFCVACDHHNGRLKLADLPDWDWHDISVHLKCTACGKVGWVDTRMDGGEAINFARGVSG